MQSVCCTDDLYSLLTVTHNNAQKIKIEKYNKKRTKCCRVTSGGCQLESLGFKPP